MRILQLQIPSSAEDDAQVPHVSRSTVDVSPLLPEKQSLSKEKSPYIQVLTESLISRKLNYFIVDNKVTWYSSAYKVSHIKEPELLYLQ